MARGKRRKQAWLREHARDAYVRRAQEEGYRSRAVYKLIEIDRRYRLLRPGQIVIDLGAAPGSWSEYARRQVGPSGRVLAVDVAAMSPLGGVEFICGDIGDPAVLDLLAEALVDTAADLVISDMAPNISGDAVADQARTLALGERVLAVAKETLRDGGQLLVKAFQGEGFASLRGAMQPYFDKIHTCKPQASRSRSREIYLLGQGFHRARGRL